MTSLICGPQKGMIQINKTQRDSQKTNLWLPGGRDSQGFGEGHVCTAIFKMDNQQKNYCIVHGILLNVMCQPGWEEVWGENGYMCIIADPLLFT